MSCEHFKGVGIRQAEMSLEQTSETPMLASLVETLFRELIGSWNLRRRLQSTNTSEPAGNCVGNATFTPREPSVFVGDDGKLDLAVSEMVYHEQGHFEMHQVSAKLDSPRFPFSRKYVWRLQRDDAQQRPILSIWFTKIGTDKIDYLFHKVNLTVEEPTVGESVSKVTLHGNGGHLCIEDLYGSEYTFDFRIQEGITNNSQDIRLESWQMLHEVRGPQKDQLIQTSFDRDECNSSQSI